MAPPARIGVHPLFGSDVCGATVLPKRVKVPFSRSCHTLLLTAWRAKDRKAGSGSYFLRYSGFPLHPRQVSACSASGLSEGTCLPIRLPDPQEFHAPSEVEESCTQSEL